ncbi:hypothetical protein [Achromobacter marplatensis]|uniref:hypothetical protein n=1 Tax=Achromobacter marplatensis TaxID=470868 RepID=UPI0039F734E9
MPLEGPDFARLTAQTVGWVERESFCASTQAFSARNPSSSDDFLTALATTQRLLDGLRALGGNVLA